MTAAPVPATRQGGLDLEAAPGTPMPGATSKSKPSRRVAGTGAAVRPAASDPMTPAGNEPRSTPVEAAAPLRPPTLPDTQEVPVDPSLFGVRPRRRRSRKGPNSPAPQLATTGEQTTPSAEPVPPWKRPRHPSPSRAGHHRWRRSRGSKGTAPAERASSSAAPWRSSRPRTTQGECQPLHLGPAACPIQSASGTQSGVPPPRTSTPLRVPARRVPPTAHSPYSCERGHWTSPRVGHRVSRTPRDRLGGELVGLSVTPTGARPASRFQSSW